MSLRAVIGLHACLEAKKIRPRAIKEIWLKTGFERSAQLKVWADFAKAKKIVIKEQSDRNLDRIGSGHQGLCIFLDESPKFDYKTLDSEQMLLVALDEVEDPHNLGAVLRTAWLFGAKAVFVPERRSAQLTATVAKVASGGAEHVAIEVVHNLPQTLEEIKKHDFWIYGLAHQGKQELWQLELPKKVIWVVGSEDSGLRKTCANVCDELVSIRQTDSSASFNASVATAIAISETARQWNNL